MKSHASDLLELAICIYKDAMAKCTVEKPDNRDILTLISRVKHEGLSFLTITLPSFGQDFERSLEEGCINPTFFRSFKKNGAIPAFLQGMLGLVFDAGTGRIFENVEEQIAAIEGIRQIAYAFKKLKLPCTLERVRRAFNGFIKDEQDLKEPLDPGSAEYFSSVANHVWAGAFGDFNSLESIPKHGPGSTRERITGNGKFVHRVWHDRLEPYFPMLHFAFSSESAYGSKEFEQVTVVDEEQELPVRVITVPKTLKSPRIIAIEPVCMQYTQQAVSRYLVSRLERLPISSGHVNFTRQDFNRALSLSSSKDKSFATLDLSAASDRVPLSLVSVMLGQFPDLLGAVLACRSKRASLPTGEILHLHKFASMGSALCFPIESMYFYTICIGALLKKHNLPVTRRNVYKMSRFVYVYGDDILVPVDAAETVADHLQKYYCKVNMSKSFWNGNFRESCGMDAFAGEEVTPTYIRELVPSNRRDSSALVSWIKTSNLLWKKGYWLASTFMKNKCESVIGPLPIVRDTSAGLGWYSFTHAYQFERVGGRYQRPEVRTWVACPVYRTDKLNEYAALTKSLLRLEESDQLPVTDSKHLVRSARYGAVVLKRRWTQPF